MESGRLDLVSGVEVNGTNGLVVATTYKLSSSSSLPEDNSQETEEKIVIEMVKKDSELEPQDGADEKMLNDDETSINPNKSPTEVVFISENGDAKIDIQNIKNVLTGMGKEELMKYANDPFWVRLRWMLFIGFWIIWFGMLGGAITIIALAPKCSAPVPKKWWEESPIVQIQSRNIEGKDLQSVESLLDTLKAQHIKTISLAGFLKGSFGHTEDFKDVKSEIGDLDYVDKIIKATEKREQHVVLELDPNYSSINHPWFKRSIDKEEPYVNYYVWADGINLQPPNNWISINGGSAWTWNNQRKQYYLHQFNETQPDLNFHNPRVVEEFNEIFAFWAKRGVSGFRLGTTRYLTEDPSLRSEKTNLKPAGPSEYQYLVHVHTKDREENAEILQQWRNAIKNITNNDELFSLNDYIGLDTLAVFNQESRLIDLPQSSQFFTAENVLNAKNLHDQITYWASGVNVSWPGWDLNVNGKPLRKRVPADVADSIALMTLLLPGTPIFTINDTTSNSAQFAKLAAERSKETFLYGDFKTYIVNGTVFVYTRLKSGLPGYLVAYQSSEMNAVIDISELAKIPAEVSVFAYSPNYILNGTNIPEKLASMEIPIAAKSTLVVSFAPKD